MAQAELRERMPRPVLVAGCGVPGPGARPAALLRVGQTGEQGPPPVQHARSRVLAPARDTGLVEGAGGSALRPRAGDEVRQAVGAGAPRPLRAAQDAAGAPGIEGTRGT